MTTAADIINRSLRLIGAIGEGETPSGTVGQTSLQAMNAMLSSWSTERLSVYATQDQTFTWPASTISRTLGPTGQLVGSRPILVDDSTYFKVNNLSYNLMLINQDQYNSIALKTATSTYPNLLFVNMTFPNIEMYVYPVPTQALEMHIISVVELSQPASLATTLSFPPGYERAFAFNLACELAPEMGLGVPQQVARMADVSKRNLKRINNPNELMAMPYAMTVTRQRFNIFAPNY